MSINCRLVKINVDGGEISCEPYFTSHCSSVLNDNQINGSVEEALGKISNDLDNYLNNGSGWTLEKVLKVYINVARYKPLKGHSFIELPRKLKNTKAIINIQNTNDHRCFIYSVLAALHTVQDAQRVTKYILFIHELNLSGIDMPMKLQQIPKFEKLNKILIKDLNKLLYHQSKSKRRKYFCPSCLHGFIRQDLLEQHLPYCTRHTPQKIEMPSVENKWLKFKNFAHQMRVKFCIYADFESMLPKVTTCDPDPGKSNTTPVQKHIPCGFCYKVVCSNERYSKEPVVYRGPDTVKHFLHAMQKEERYILNTLKKLNP